MSWVEPMYSKGDVRRAGETYVDPAASAEERELALAVINNFRSSHAFPLNTFQVGLRRRASSIDSKVLVAQRIKRLPSIRAKLHRFPGMQLSRMQDIGGCRAVLRGIREVYAVDEGYKQSRVKHTMVRRDDYIATPQPSGYRGIHRSYRYYSDRQTTYNGLLVEVQIRSRAQHVWATAVETVGTFTRQSLKSSKGEKEWLRFFSLMSSELAFREDSPIVPGTPKHRPRLHDEICSLAVKLDVVSRLTAYGATLRYLEEMESRDRYWILELDPSEMTLLVRGYKDAAVANDAYKAVERAADEEPGPDVVLVSVNAVAGLRRAYPNYYLDTTEFTGIVGELLANR